MHFEERLSPNFGLASRREVRAVVVHTTDGTFSAAAAWLTDARSGVSAHYLVGLDGRILNLVREHDVAHHAGTLVTPTAAHLAELGGDPNRTTVGIEFADGGDPGGVERPDAQYVAGAALLRGLSRRWGIPIDREHVIAHRELRADKTCPGNLDIERLIGLAARPRIVCLLPARNEERNLPEWLEHASTFCDAVVALDDGSTDRTREILEAHPLVARLLSNPPRPDYRGWDDAANRQRLLDAAADLDPTWIVQVDADERIDAPDASALRAFLETDALPGCAYGFLHHRVWGGSVDPQPVWVYRVFAYQPGASLPAERRLHFNPVPTSIPRRAWIRTSIRLRHLGAADPRAVEERIAKYAQADPEGVFEANTNGMDGPPPPDRSLVPWRDRTDPRVLVPAPEDLTKAGARPSLLVLLPVRNGERDIPGFLDSVRRFADGVIALDDGSTDATQTLLENDPLVIRTLSNPTRASWRGWDEPRDRQRLLDAAADTAPRFVLFLDVDERIDAGDGGALRSFVAAEAVPGFAYGMRVHRMVREDPPGWDRADLWVYRLFGWRPGLRLPDRPLHLVPVPVDIPTSNYVRTTVRIQHLAGLTPERRRERFDKYAELDPRNTWQPGYDHLLDEPSEVHDWSPRAEDLAVVPPDEIDLDAPVLSAIVIARDDALRIERPLRALVEQETEEPFEVIVVVSGSDATARVVRERFPEVTLVELERPVLPGAARNAGLGVARGDYASFPGSHVELAAGSLQARIRAHERGYPMVTGSMLNGTKTRAGWANFLLDHASALPGRPGGELSSPPAHCSYDRDLLVAHGGFPEDLRAGEDTAVNNRLFAAGLKAYRSPDIRLTHVSRCETAAELLLHHLQRGRGLGRLLFDPAYALPARRDTRRMLLSYVPRRIRSVASAVGRWGSWEEREAYRSSYPLIVAATVASWAGALGEGVRLTARRGYRAVKAAAGE